jgi:hypothetical protein
LVSSKRSITTWKEEEETCASAFVVPVRLRRVAVVHEQRERCISDVAMMLTKKIIIIIIIIGRRRREYRFRSSREKKEEREEKEKARFWSPGRKRKRRRKARRHLRTTRRLRDDTVNESILRIKRIRQPFFSFFLSLSFFFVLTRQMFSRFLACFSLQIKDDAFKLVLWL